MTASSTTVPQTSPATSDDGAEPTRLTLSMGLPLRPFPARAVDPFRGCGQYRPLPSRRIPDRATLEREVAAWEAERNATGGKVDRRFTTHDARIKLKRLYPAL